MTPQKRSETGLALISVLWVLLLLSSLAATAMYVARTNAILTHRELEIARLEAAADAAVVATISRLSDDQVAVHPAVDGATRSWEFAGVPIQIAVTNEAGRIDINAAEPPLLRAFLESRGLAPETAAKLVEELRPANGLGQPRHLLETPEELRALRSWQTQDLDCWLNFLTVYTGLPGVAPQYASPATLTALQKATRNGSSEAASSASTAAASPVAPDAQSVLGEVLRIRATATLAPDLTTTSEWVGRLTGDRRKPMLTMRWDHGVSNKQSSCGSSS